MQVFSFLSFHVLGCAMSGLIADAKTLIDKARVETQVWFQSTALYKAYLECCVYLRLTCMRSVSEPLVHLQWDDDSGECDSGCVQPGAAVWGGRCRPWCHGESLSQCLCFHFEMQTKKSLMFNFYLCLYFVLNRVDLSVLRFCLGELMKKDLSCMST